MDTERTSFPQRGTPQFVTERVVEPYPAPSPVYRQAPPDWQRYFQAVMRQKWLVLAIIGLGTAAGGVGAHLLGPRYAAKAVLWIESVARQPDRGVVTGDQLVRPSSWVELITSNAVLDSVVRERRLYLTPRLPRDSSVFAHFEIRPDLRPGRYRLAVDRRGAAFALLDGDGALVQRGAVGDTVGLPLGFAWLPPVEAIRPGQGIDFDVTAPYDAVLALAERLKVRLDSGGSLLRIQLTGADPYLTTATVNAVSRRAVTIAAELKRQKFEELSKILAEQHQHAKQTLLQAEAGLETFRVRTAGVIGQTAPAVSPSLAQRADPVLAHAFDLRLSLEQLRRDRWAIEEALRQIPRSGLRLQALTIIPSVQQSPQLSLAVQEATRKEAELRVLRYRYTEESAFIQNARAELRALEEAAIPQLARELIAELSAREVALVPQTDSAFRYLRDVPPLALQEARLRREVASAEELFNAIDKSYASTRLALVSNLPDLRILDAAMQPHRPSGDFAPLLITLSFLVSAGLAGMAVAVREQVDPKIRYPEQVTREMRLPILGAVPHVSWRHANGVGAAEVIEAIRGLRVRLLHAHGADGPLLFTITSPGMGEGKSFVSANLALSFASAGYRTLLIDGDIRRGTQHKVLDVAQRPGLTDVLAGHATADTAVQETDFAGLRLLSCGTWMRSAPELLLSRNLKELIGGINAYDVVVVDSPPLAAGADPLVLATATRNLLVVLRSGATDVPLAVSKLDGLSAFPVRTIGAVLNDVRGGSAFRYYRYDVSGYALPQGGSAGDGHGGPNILGAASW
ncbi:MAG: polysaccharide biosynthesis tyrosine autokinase [Gemmatimonadetes bacterium]|nr:polysaccharide biosynthesis tyrosine autokinase [Gemmatimonadota bacterium]